MDWQLIAAVIAVVIELGTSGGYLYSVIKGKTKPHIFTWLIWTIIIAAAFFGQVTGGAGIGSIALGLTAGLNLVILVFSFRISKDHVTKLDITLFIAAILSLIPWIIANDPVLSIIFLSAVYILAVGPTFRKSYYYPTLEPILPFAFTVLKHTLILIAVAQYNLLTVLFPFVAIIINISLSSLLIIKRRQLKKAVL